MKKQLKIFGHPTEDTGVGFYRIVQPLKEIGSKKLADVRSVIFTGDMKIHTVEIEEYDKNSKWADILYATSAKSQMQAAYFMAARDVHKLKLVIDIDDNLIQLNNDHPNAQNLIKSDAAYWVQKSLAYADLVVVTQPYLIELYGKLNDNFYVNPNSVNLDLWDTIKPEKHDKIRIGWAGASGHENDLRILRHVIPELRKKYGDKIEFWSMGQKPMSVNFDYHMGWYSINEYPDAYQSADFDIILAPLRDTAYNRCKSNLRLIEAGACKIPIVASPNGPYKDFPCLYAEETEDWVNAISSLIESETKRKEWGEKAYKEVKEKYDIKVTAPKLLERLEQEVSKKWKKRQEL